MVRKRITSSTEKYQYTKHSNNRKTDCANKKISMHIYTSIVKQLLIKPLLHYIGIVICNWVPVIKTVMCRTTCINFRLPILHFSAKHESFAYFPVLKQRTDIFREFHRLLLLTVNTTLTNRQRVTMTSFVMDCFCHHWLVFLSMQLQVYMSRVLSIHGVHAGNTESLQKICRNNAGAKLTAVS